MEISSTGCGDGAGAWVEAERVVQAASDSSKAQHAPLSNDGGMDEVFVLD